MSYSFSNCYANQNILLPISKLAFIELFVAN